MNPYSLDVKSLFASANEPEDATSDNAEDDSGPTPYGLPGMPAAAQGAGIGPHFREALARSPLGALARAATPAVAPVAPILRTAAQYGMDAVQPGVSAIADRAGLFDKPGGKRGDFMEAGPPKNRDEYLYRLAHYESKGNPAAHNPKSTASGAFQYTDDTWGNYGGYKSALHAPMEVQYKRASEDLDKRLAHNNGDLVATTLTHFLGSKGLQKVLSKPELMFRPVNRENGGTTPYDYASGILGRGVADKWLADIHQKNGAVVEAHQNPYNLPANGMADSQASN